MSCSRYLVAVTALLASLACAAHAGDWPQILGPQRNGVAPHDESLTDWPADGPRTLWQRAVGEGYAGPVVADSRVVIFHSPNRKDTVECLDLATGKPLWSYQYPANFRDRFGFDHGPRATPTIDLDTATGARRVYTHGSQGLVHCLDFDTGKVVWSLDTQQRFDAPQGWFGRACSPLVVDQLVLLNVGGTGGIIALDKATGELKWQAADHEASYASPVAATIAGRRYAIFFTRAGLVVLDPTTGKVHATHPWRPDIDASVNAANPIVVGDLVLLSTSYDTGAIVLRITGDGAARVWSGEAMSNHYATSVPRDGYAYGLDGRQEYGVNLRCVEVKTGEVKWSHDGLPAGSLMLVKDELLMLTEDGELMRIAASPEGYKLLGKASILGGGIRAYPAISDGKLIARDTEKLVCVEVGADAQRTRK